MLTQTLENLLNRNLASSPAARELCAELTGRRIAIAVEGIGVRVVIESLGTSLRLSRDPDVECDATVSGTPVNLLALLGGDPAEPLRRGRVQMRGDAELVQRFQRLGHLLRPDVEEELSRAVGDVAAHRLGEIARGILGFGERVARTTVRNTAEYFAHETGDLVPRAEADVFLRDVDRLREDVDRLEARLALLVERLQPAASVAPPLGDETLG